MKTEKSSKSLSPNGAKAKPAASITPDVSGLKGASITSLSSVMRLQGLIGNQAVQRLLQQFPQTQGAFPVQRQDPVSSAPSEQLSTQQQSIIEQAEAAGVSLTEGDLQQGMDEPPNMSAPPVVEQGTETEPNMSVDPNASSAASSLSAPATTDANMSMQEDEPNMSVDPNTQTSTVPNSSSADSTTTTTTSTTSEGDQNQTSSVQTDSTGTPNASFPPADSTGTPNASMPQDTSAQVNMTPNVAGNNQPNNQTPNQSLPNGQSTGNPAGQRPNANDPNGQPQETPTGGTPAGGTPSGTVNSELAEHQRWGQVGQANSSDRAMFIAQAIGQGELGGLQTGAALGLGVGLGTRAATYGVGRAVTVYGPRIASNAAKFTPVPAVGAIIAGGFAVHSLVTRNWSNSWADITRFGQGEGDYAPVANTIQSISTILEIASNIANVIAGVLGLISAGMWVAAVLSAGVLSPLAATLSSIAATISIVTTVIDLINQTVLQPLIVLFRSLDTFTTQADPAVVQQQGTALAQAAAGPAAALGAYAGGRAAEIGNRPAPTAAANDAPPARPETDIPPASGDGPTLQVEVPAGQPGEQLSLNFDGPAPSTSSAADAPTPTTSRAEPEQLSFNFGDGPAPSTSSAADVPSTSSASSAADVPAGNPAANGQLDLPMPGLARPEPGPTPQPQATADGDLRLSYPVEGGPFRYESGPQPETNPFANLTDAEINGALRGLDALEAGQTPPPGSISVGTPQRVDMGRFDPNSPANQGNTGWRNPLSPPGEFAYGAPGAPATGNYHGAVGRSTQDAAGNYHYHPAEVFAVTPDHPTYAVRTGPGGSYVDHIFNTREEAIAYAQRMSQVSEGQIRSDSALPPHWPDGNPGNPVDAMRVFEIPPNTPYLRSGIAPQPGAGGVYAGGGPQTQLPYGTVGRNTPALAEIPITNRGGGPTSGGTTPPASTPPPAPTSGGSTAATTSTPPPTSTSSSAGEQLSLPFPQSRMERFANWGNGPEAMNTFNAVSGFQTRMTNAVPGWARTRPGGYRVRSYARYLERNEIANDPNYHSALAEGIDYMTGAGQDQGQQEQQTEVVTVPVTPNYTAPPGTPADLEALQCEIDSLRSQESRAARTERTAASEVAEGQQNMSTMEQTIAQTDQSITHAQEHQQETQNRTQANQQGQQQQRQAQETTGSYAERAAGMGTLKVLLNGFIGMMHLFSYLPGGARRYAERTSGDARRFLNSLNQADQAVAGVRAQQPQQQAQWQTEQQQLQSTQQQNQTTQEQLNTTREGAVGLQQENQSRTENAQEVQERASQQREQICTEIEQREQQAETLSSQMTEWSVQHQEERQNALITAQQNAEAQGMTVVGVNEQ